MNSAITYPVQVLREHLTQIEAAISVCLAEPDPKSVHQLRTETRRVEALLLLLALVPGLPEHRKQAAALLRAIAKLRRAAGKVRDLDVHRKMLESLTAGDDNKNKDATGADSANKRSADPAGLSKSAKKLRKHMGAERDKAATALEKLLEKRQVKIAGATEDLMSVLEPAEDLTLNAPDVLRDAQSVLTRNGLLKPSEIAALTGKDLHTVRKAAKAARYVAESVADDPALREAARALEALQDAGGQWHDTLELARAARRSFGKNHPLTALFRQEREATLEAYRTALQANAAKEAPAAKRKSAKRVASKQKAVA